MAESKTSTIVISILAALAVLGLVLVLGAWLFIGRLADVFAVPESELTRVSLAQWAGTSLEDADEITLLVGEASPATGDRWAYRGFIDDAFLQSRDLQFGYHAGFFEQITSIPASSGCSVNGKPRGRSITLSINGRVLQARRNCRLSALDIDDLWERATPVTLHDALLPREEHRARLAAIRAEPTVRLIGYQDDYVRYDKVIRVALPTVWGEPAEVWEDRIDSRLEAAIQAAFETKGAAVSLQFSGRAAEGPGAPLSPRPWPGGSDEPFEGYAVSGDGGLRMVTGLDLLTAELWIRCEATACDTVATTDFSALVAPFRDFDLLQKAYDAARAGTEGEAVSSLRLDRIRDESVAVQPPIDLAYPLSWIEKP